MMPGRLKFTIKKFGKCLSISKMEPGKSNNERGLKYTVRKFECFSFKFLLLCLNISDKLTFF